MIARRAPHKKMPGKWEFPGGKIEEGETPEMALKRELEEEFGVQVEVGAFFNQNTHDYKDFKIELSAYFAKCIQGNFNLTDHDLIKWVRREDLRKFDLTEADIPFVTRLLER